MKNKKLTGLFCVLALCVVIIVVCGVVFTLKKAEVYFINENGQYVQVEKETEDNVDTSCFKSFFGKNMLFLDTDAIVQKTEQANLGLKVVRVEKSFPNKVRVFVTVRVPVYYIVVDGQNYICSHDGFVMQQGGETKNLVFVDGSYGQVSAPSVGSYIKGNFATADCYDVIQNFFASANAIEGFEYGDIPSLFKSITFEGDNLICKTQSNATFVISNPTQDFGAKFNDVYASYVQNADKQDGGTFVLGEKLADGKYAVSAQ
ncbi:MAG: hypothetical protein IJV77_03555 [Clostridia bacterium]|nr:hypothetical protein [Clostridia bacterium]